MLALKDRIKRSQGGEIVRAKPRPPRRSRVTLPSSRPTKFGDTQKELTVRQMLEDGTKEWMKSLKLTSMSFPGPAGPPGPSGGNLVDARDFGFKDGDDATQVNGNWVQAIAQTPNGATLMMPAGRALVINGTSTNKAILVTGQSHASGIKFVPTTPNDTLLSFTHSGSPAFARNDDGQLIGSGFKDIGIFSDRSVQANGVYFLRTDWDVLDNVLFYGLDGYAVRRSNSRECHWTGTYAKYCGHSGLVDPTTGVASFLFDSDDGGDTTNLCQFENFSSVFSFWDNLYVKNASRLIFGKALLHGMARGLTTLEQLICNEFGGTPGWTGGVANNQFSAMHHAPSPNAANVSGAHWIDSVYKFCVFRSVASRGTFYNVQAPGVSSDICFRIDDASGWVFENGEYGNAEGSTSNWTTGTFQGSAANDTVTFSTPQTGLFTGDPVTISTSDGLHALGSGVPGGIANPNTFSFKTYYAINVDGLAQLVYKLATSYVNALAGTFIDITSDGDGTGLVNCQHSDMFCVLNGSYCTFGPYAAMGTGRRSVNSDDSSVVLGLPVVTVSSSNDISRVLTVEHPVAILRNGILGGSLLNIDQGFTPLPSTGNNKIILTSAWAKSTVGSSAGGPPLGGIYTAAGKGGLTVVDPQFDWSAMSFSHWIMIPLSDSVSQVPIPIGALFYLNMDQIAVNGLACDIVFYGVYAGGIA